MGEREREGKRKINKVEKNVIFPFDIVNLN